MIFMKTVKNLIQAPKVIKMTKLTESKITTIASKLEGQNLFTDKIELAKRSLENVTSLPY